MKKKSTLLRLATLSMLIGVMVLSYGCEGKKKTPIKTLPYPETRTENVVDNYHGTEVADPYRWLEDDMSDETAEWVVAQNTVTKDYLSHIPYREAIKTRLTQLWDYPTQSIPVKKGDWYYFSKNDGLQNQSVIYRSKEVGGEAEIFIDPNKFSEDGTVALGGTSFSEDGKYCAYLFSEAGSDWTQIKIINTETLDELDDHLMWVKFSGAGWSADSKGFYYSRYDEPKEGSALSGKNEYHKVFYHKLGEKQENDKLIFCDNDHPLRNVGGYESDDGKYLFVRVTEGTHGNSILMKESANLAAEFTTLFKGFANDYSVVYSKDDKAYVYTNEGAENYRLLRVDLKNPKAAPTVILPEKEHLLQSARVVGGGLIAFYLEDAKNTIYQYDMDGELVRQVELAELGSVGGFAGDEETEETYYAITTFTAPGTIYKYDFESGKSEMVLAPEVNYDPSLYTTEQVFFESKDGTMVPMFIVHRKDMELNGDNPLHLYGYGGFNNPVTPRFSPNNILFLEQGGIYVVVSLRGGGEYGEAWHKGGMLEKKQNVFDDFIYAAEYLIDNKYTSKGKLAISGGSNGGLLVGACMTQRPDLFAVTFPMVGVLDMLRYHMFTIGWAWAVEYGSSDNPEHFDFLYAYSPLHNIKKGECYPATMITTADHDDRVVPAHSYKFAATMQKAQGCDNPILIRIDSDAGHGAGKPTSKRIEEATDMYSFMFWNTDTEVVLKVK